MTARVPLRDALAEATARLAAAGVDSPAYDARALAGHLAGVTNGRLAAVDDIDGAAYRMLVDRRASREPLQHIVGSAGFRHLELAVGPGVFIPRPETELVAEAAITAARHRCTAGAAARVVDLCTGTAAIALAVAEEVPGSEVHAVERDPVAAGWARRNIEATGLPVRLHVADVAHALPEYAGRVDVVVANPPYVPEDERATVAPEVLRDPDGALWGGRDGLAVIRVVAATASRLLAPGGVLVVEHSDRHGQAAPRLLGELGGWADVADHEDLAGRPRYVTARRSA